MPNSPETLITGTRIVGNPIEIVTNSDSLVTDDRIKAVALRETDGLVEMGFTPYWQVASEPSTRSVEGKSLVLGRTISISRDEETERHLREQGDSGFGTGAIGTG